MNKKLSFNNLINDSIANTFRDALRVSFKSPGSVWFFYHLLYLQKRAARARLKWEKRGVHVPPFMIASVTDRCNLRCKGCYAQAQHRPLESLLSSEKLRAILQEAESLGISIVLIAGGEPLVRPDMIETIGALPKIVFPLFTNGLLITKELTHQLSKRKNIIPVISLEGYRAETDARRGDGVFGQLEKLFSDLQKNRIFFGVSLTMTRLNFDIVTSKNFIHDLIDSGSRLFFFVEYVPIQAGTEDLTLTAEQRNQILGLMSVFRIEFPGLFIAFPGDEESFGGCLAAGRGFIHVSANGNLEPCPFAPFSDTSLHNLSLKEALKSELLAKIRQNEAELSQTQGGCVLWAKKDWVRSLLEQSPPQ